jgi:hypothetical protein
MGLFTMTLHDPMFAYFRTTDNTIAEQELERFDPTSGTYGVQVAYNFADAFGFELIEYGTRKWQPEDWDAAYAVAERYGYYTPERWDQLFN